MSIKNSNDTNWIRSSDLHCIAVCFKTNLVSAPEDSDITVTKRVGAIETNVSVTNNIDNQLDATIRVY